MSRTIRKALVIGMIITTMAATITGCSNKVETGTTQQTTEGTSSGQATQKPKDLKFMVNIGVTKDDGSDKWVEEFKNKTDINLDLQYTSGSEYYQKLELAFASGQAPDAFAVGDGKLPIYVSQGALIDLTEMASQSEAVAKMDPELIESIKIDGKIYGIPMENGGGTVTYMRQDWLDQVGKEIPTNYEEFIDVLRAFKTVKPDAIPFTAPGLVGGQAEVYLREFYQDASPEFVQVDGQWVDGMMQANMVDALERMRDAYAEGLIDMEVITNKTSTCRDKWYAGDVGVFTYWAGNWNVSLENRVQENNPDAKVVAIPAIEETYYIKRVPAVVGISALAKDPEAVFEHFIEYMHDGGEGSTLFQHGVEGVHYDQKESEIVHLPKISKPDEILEKAFISPVLAVTEVEDVNYAVDERIGTSLEVLEAYGRQAISVPASKALGKMSSDLLALREKTVSSIVIGQTTVEEGLAKYEAEAKNLGIETVIAELNAK